MHRTRKRPVGRPTRGKTATNRLRRLDAYLCAQEAALIRRRDASAFLDLGFGRDPRTTLESAVHFRRLNPGLRVVGSELDRERVAEALPATDALTRFVHGGFEVEVGPVRLLRAMNVLRQYAETDVAEARALMGARLVEGGLLVEGTSSPTGSLLVVHLHRKRGPALVDEGLLFSARLRADFGPVQLQPVLPKDLIHRVVPGEPIHTLMEDWQRTWLAHRHLAPFGPRQVWVAVSEELSRRWRVDRRRWMARRGYLRVQLR